MGAGMFGGITYLPPAPGERAPAAQVAMPVRSATAPVGPRADLVADLTKLKELLDSGALTAEEFAAAKTKLLG
jgi:putative oligomerization/nucleic acid binding protein